MMITRTMVGALLVAVLGGAAHAADAPSSADVLKDLHHANQEEIEMGKIAQDKGQSKDVKKFGKTLVKDHTAADKKVTALAKDEKIDLGEMPVMKDNMPEGADFDASFARAMLEGHQKVVSEATAARDSTGDEKLKKLLVAIIPTLQKHLDTAQKLSDAAGKK